MSSQTAKISARALFLCILCPSSAFPQTPKDFAAAAAAFEAGNFAEAERLVREGLSHHPRDVSGLNLLAVALDGQKKYSEAEAVYKLALNQGSDATLLNNLANHYLATGRKDKARSYYEQALRRDPHHSNALCQLARFELEDHRPSEALARLRLLPEAERRKPAALLLLAQALFESGQAKAARQFLTPLEASRDTDLSVAFSLGVLYYREKLYAESIRAFEAALHQSPGDFDILYNLGLAYNQGGEKDRAAEVLERAVRVNTNSADALYRLAVVMDELGRDETASALLIRAREAAPDRPELSLLLARECSKQEFWLDASEAYQAYLRAKPEDWNVRWELALVYGRLRDFENALSQMDRYVAARPKDAKGFYLRGLIAWHLKRSAAAAKDFRHAIELNPRQAESWSRLGEIGRQRNDLGEAERRFRRALEIDPKEPNALYGLGQVLNARGQYREAASILQKATAGRPDEPAPHYQLSLTYRRSGQESLARAEMQKFQELRKTSGGTKYPRTGLVAYVREGMKLSESERRARELQYLERAAAIKADDTGIRERLVNAYLDAGKKAQADESIRQWLTQDASGQAALKAGTAMARHGDYDAAIPYFSQAANHPALAFVAQVRMADAKFHLGQYAPALALLSQLTPPLDDADYYLLRASILDKLQRYEEALASYELAIRAQPRQENPYLELGLFFVAHQAFDAAIEDFRAAQKVLPQSLKLAVGEAIVLNLAGHREDSFERLRGIEKRWPEQDWPYILAGISAYTAYRYEDSRREFEKAAALESTNPLTYYYLALLDTASPQGDSAEALRWAEMAVKDDPQFAQGRLLLGKIYNRQGKTAEALENLEEAVRLEPNLADAHYLLSRIYAQLGETTRAETERSESERWHREVHQVSPDKENIVRLLVEVEPVGQ